MQKAIKKYKGGVKLTVNPKVYPLSTIYSAGYVFLDRAYIYLDKDSKAKVTVWLFPKSKKENLDKLGMEFYNELLNYAHYFGRIKANSDIIKMIMQRALFSANPSFLSEVEDRKVEDLIKELDKEESNKKSKPVAQRKKR